MADNISNIVDSSVIPELQALIDKLGQVEKAIASASDEAKNIKVNLSGAESIATLTSQIEKMSVAIADLNMVRQQSASITAQQTQIDNTYGAGTGDLAFKVANLKESLFHANEMVKELNNQLGKGKITQEQFDAEITQTTLDINTYKLALKSTNDELNKLIISNNASVTQTNLAADSMVGLAAKLKELKTQYSLLDGAARKTAEGIALAGEIKNVATELTVAGRAIQNTTNSMSIMDRATVQSQRIFVRFIAMMPEMLGFMALYKLFDLATESIMKNYNELQKYNEALRQHHATMQENIQSEKANAESLLQVAKNTNLAMTVRKNAIDELRKSTGSLLQDYKDEIFLAGQTAEAHDKIAESILHENMAKMYGQSALEANKKLSEFTAPQVDEKGLLMPSKLDIAKAAFKAAENQFEDASNKVIKGNNTFDVIRERYEATKKNLEEINKQVALYQNQVNSFNQLQQKQLEDYYKLFPEKAKKAGAEGLTSLSTGGTTGDKRYISALADEKKKEVELDLEAQREIVNNQKLSLKERLEANIKYQHDVNQIAQIEAEKQISINDVIKKDAEEKIGLIMNRYAEIEAGKGGKNVQAHKQENLNLLNEKLAEQLDVIAAAQLGIKNAHTGMNLAMEKNLADTEQRQTNIYKTNGEQQIQIQEDVIQKIKDGDLRSAIAQQEALKKQLDDKLITREEYNKKVEELIKALKKKELEAEIEGYGKDLSSGNLTALQRTDILRKQDAAKQSLLGLQTSDNKSDQRNKHVTDSLAIGLIGGDLGNLTDTQKKYLEDFYSHSVDLAKKATDAIIQMKDNEYQHEQELLDRQGRNIQIQAEQRILAIQASTGFEIQKSNQLRTVAAQTQAQEDTIEKKKKQAAIDKARFDRTASEAKIIQDTAMSISGVYAAYAGIPGGILIASILAGLVASIGAVELATASSAPIPSFRYGTTATTTPFFIAGEAGEQELITNPDGTSKWSGTTAKLFHEPLGTSVTPISKLKDFAEKSIANSYSGTDTLNIVMAERRTAEAYKYMADAVSGEIKQQTNAIVNAIIRSGNQPSPDFSEMVRFASVTNKLKGI